MQKENKNRDAIQSRIIFKIGRKERKGKIQGENNPHTHFQAIHNFFYKINL